MKKWQDTALRMLPELQSEIEAAETPMSLWLELVYSFDDAYKDPRNEDFIRRVYGYADWCLLQSECETAEEHLPTCVAIVFWEHIPTQTAARNDMPRWFSLDEVVANQHFFKYSLSDQEFEELKSLYSASNGSGQPTG